MASEKYEDCFVKRARGISGSSIGLVFIECILKSSELFFSEDTAFQTEGAFKSFFVIVLP